LPARAAREGDTTPKPYPPEFRDDVVKVAQRRPEGTTLEEIANDFGIHPMTLSKWLRQAAPDDGDRLGATGVRHGPTNTDQSQARIRGGPTKMLSHRSSTVAMRGCGEMEAG
jgi:transposase-like protein